MDSTSGADPENPETHLLNIDDNDDSDIPDDQNPSLALQSSSSSTASNSSESDSPSIYSSSEQEIVEPIISINKEHHLPNGKGFAIPFSGFVRHSIGFFVKNLYTKTEQDKESFREELPDRKTLNRIFPAYFPSIEDFVFPEHISEKHWKPLQLDIVEYQHSSSSFLSPVPGAMLPQRPERLKNITHLNPTFPGGFTMKHLWIGHATSLVSIDGMNIITDPVFSSKIGFNRILSVSRYTNIPALISELPPIDIVIISHSHHDHLDVRSIKQLLDTPYPPKHWFCGLGLKSWFLRQDARFADIVTEMDWWETKTVSIPKSRNSHLQLKEPLKSKPLRGPLDVIKVSCVPAQHWSGRYYLDKNKTLWCGFAVSGPSGSFYFSGDSGHSTHIFLEIGKRYGPFDLAILPTGAYCPRRTHKPVHMNPDDACLIKQEVCALRAVGIHYGTFGNKTMGYRPILRPFVDLANARKKYNLSPSEFFLTPVGCVQVFPTGYEFGNKEHIHKISQENNDRGIPEIVIQSLLLDESFDNKKLENLEHLIVDKTKRQDEDDITNTESFSTTISST